MQIEIKDRWSGEVKVSGEFESLKAAVEAMVVERKSLEAANLGGANLEGANLGAANLRGANLGGAYLGGAYLEGAYLGGAKIKRLLARATRVSDDYEFCLFALEEGEPRILAGCRWLTLNEYRRHVAAYESAGKQAETSRLLNYFAATLDAQMTTEVESVTNAGLDRHHNAG